MPVTVERLKQITSSQTAWFPAYATLEEADDTRVPECTEGFMQIIAGITGQGRGCLDRPHGGCTSIGRSLPFPSLPEERYKPLPGIVPQLRFLELQRDLLLEFHEDLTESSRRLSCDPLVPQFCAYLNASNYIIGVLRSWGEQLVSLTTTWLL